MPLIRPLCVADFKTVKMKLARYEAGEVAHIENVMGTESRSREHRRLHQTEETVVREVEVEQESRRDLQSTERFEMETEIKNEIKEETSTEVGVDVSGSYGPVTVTGYAHYGSTSIREESERNASKYAKEIVQRALSRLVEKTRELRTTRLLDEVEETNRHAFENPNAAHVRGIYRWVDKYYRTKTVNYGKRLIYEFIVPEPAAFYLFASLYNAQHGGLPLRPEQPTDPAYPDPDPDDPHTLEPGHINGENYLTLVGRYGAEGVDPPPPEEVVVAHAIALEPGSEQWWAFADEESKVPKGYYASTCNFQALGAQGRGVYAYLQFGTSEYFFTTNSFASGVIYLSAYTDSVPISAIGNISDLALNIAVRCKLSDEAKQKWQLQTFQAIMNAYRKQLLDYEDRAADTQIQQGVRIGGDNPDRNRQIEREELKKACLMRWTGLDLLFPDGIRHNEDPSALPPDNYPEMNNTLEALNVDLVKQFFEESFEWDNMTYRLYPYYWGRKRKWLEVYGLENPDPLFESFLKAGTARVAVSVKPSHTEAVLYYQLTGLVWPGGPVPELTPAGDPDVDLYNGYIEEMSSVEDVVNIDANIEIRANDPETSEIKVPTTLVWLQDSGALPNLEA